MSIATTIPTRLIGPVMNNFSLNNGFIRETRLGAIREFILPDVSPFLVRKSPIY
jgi:hypothetical protein